MEFLIIIGWLVITAAALYVGVTFLDGLYDQIMYAVYPNVFDYIALGIFLAFDAGLWYLSVTYFPFTISIS